MRQGALCKGCNKNSNQFLPNKERDIDPLTLLAMANGCVAAIRKGCELYKEVKGTVAQAQKTVKEVQAIAEEVGGFFGFFKKKKPKPTEPVVAPKPKKAEAEVWDEGRVVADLAANLSQFFKVQQQLADHIREEEEKSKTVYDPNQNIMESALNRELAKTQFEKLAKEIREIMVYQSPPELGNLYTRVNAMRVQIIEEQEEARLAQEKRQREAEWQRRKVISAIQDKAIYGVACLVFVLYLALFFSLLVMDRKVRWGF